MAYNPKWPSDNLPIADIPAVFREIAKQLIEEQIVDAGLLQGKSASDFILLSNLINFRVNPPFVVNGNFIVPDGVTQVYVSMCGGGGGGSSVFGCAGGAGQAVYRKLVTGLTPGQVIQIIVGAGGLGGYGPMNTSWSTITIQTLFNQYRFGGTDGTASSFGNYITTIGGKGAAVTPSKAQPGEAGGPGGTFGGLPARFDLGYDNNILRKGGIGGSCIFGQGGQGGQYPGSDSRGVSRDGANGIGNGSGGGGAGEHLNFSSDIYQCNAGGNGAPGIVIVEW